ncbi:MAG TPA: hypothetical protein VIU37_02475 [Candidatus Limnocylindrales bacterium]
MAGLHAIVARAREAGRANQPTSRKARAKTAKPRKPPKETVSYVSGVRVKSRTLRDKPVTFGALGDAKDLIAEVDEAFGRVEGKYPALDPKGAKMRKFTGIYTNSNHPDIDLFSRMALEHALEATVEKGNRENFLVLNDRENVRDDVLDEHHPAAEVGYLSPAARDPLGRTLHEIGHLEANLAGVRPMQIVRALKKAGLIWEPDDGVTRGSNLSYYHTDALRDISKYAARGDPDEAFAELFAMVNHPDAFDAIPGFQTEAGRKEAKRQLDTFAEALNSIVGQTVI